MRDGRLDGIHKTLAWALALQAPVVCLMLGLWVANAIHPMFDSTAANVAAWGLAFLTTAVSAVALASYWRNR